MTIARLKHTAVAAALLAAGATAQAATLINEGFESFSALSANGWVLINSSAPIGTTSLTSGDSTIFASQSGSADSYISGNYNNAAVGGFIYSWLITPQFSTQFAGSISFWARGDIAPGYADHLSYGISNAGTGDFTGGSLSAPITVVGDWTQYTLSFAARGAGTLARFAIVYNGLADTSNYVGIDTVVVSNVPEPSTWLLLGAGMLGVAGAARRRANPSA